jgi:nucleoside-diphosphate-sugar epimerase
MNILITGGNGYIAKSLYNSLKKKYKVTCITRQDFDLTTFQAMNDFFQNKYFDAVIHCAVQGGSRLKKDSYKDMDINLAMYYNLLQHKPHYNKLIHFGSGAEIFNPESPYGLSKKIIANSISEIDNFYNIRIFGVFDENELDTRFIKNNIIRYIKKQPLEIHQNKFMDFIYMKDLISLIDYYILNNNLPKEVDCSYQIVYSLYEIINMINSLDLYEVDIILHNEELDNEYYGDGILSDVIECVGLEQGIKEVYNKLKNEY